MITDPTWAAISLCAGGLVTWLVAAFFENLVQHNDYNKEYAKVTAIINHDSEYAQVVGDVDAHLATRGIHRPDWFECLVRNGPQPLFVLSLLSLTAFKPLNLAEVLCTLAVFLLVCLHEFRGKVEWRKNRAYGIVVCAAWFLYLVLLICLVH
ncbi:MAG TPA: hypothetical protein VG722_05565 [Tepidisphaeraceae bacterium]|nr:hypothetical protein [Tepidisphaeraceae bacterium]